MPGDNWIQNGKVYKTGIVKVRYESTTGELIDAALIKGISNGTDTYQTTAKDIEGYTLKTTPANTKGKFTDAAITVTYVYEKDAVSPPSDPLTNDSTISANTVTAGTSVMLTATASGGTEPYTYAMMYRLSSSTSWKVIGTKYGTESTGSFTPASAGAYDILISIKDAEGNTASKKFSLTVEEPASALKNVSSISAANVPCGSKITITGSANGGTAPYCYTYQIKKPGKTSWTTLGDKYGTDTSKVFTAKLTGTYEVRVLIKDSSGKIKSSSFSVNVTGTLLVNKSKVSAASVNTGAAVKLTAVPSGGTEPYRYTYEYKKPGAASWKTIGKRGATYKSVSFTAETAGTYEARIYIQDASNYVTVKTFKITAS